MKVKKKLQLFMPQARLKKQQEVTSNLRHRFSYTQEEWCFGRFTWLFEGKWDGYKWDVNTNFDNYGDEGMLFSLVQ